MNLKRKSRQLLGAFIMSFPKFLFGSGMVWPSYTILFLKSGETPLAHPLTLLEEALIGSLPLVSAIFTSPFGGFIVDRIGRKYSGILTTLCVTISWILIALSKDIYVFLLGRFVFGISAGVLMQTAWSFTAEISEDSIRGFMSSMPSVMYAFGALVSIIMGWLSSYFYIIYLNIAFAIGNGLTMFFIPESPVYLNLVGREEESLRSLAFYRASSIHNQSVKDEMAIIQKNLMDNQLIKKNDDSPTSNPEHLTLHIPDKVITAQVSGIAYLKVSPAARLSLFVTCLLMTLSILTGLVAVQVYGGPLFLKATPSLSPDICAVLLAAVLFIGSFCGASSTDLFGRRVLLMSAATINGLCMILLGVLIRWPSGPTWLIPTIILIFSFFFNFGGGTIPYLLLAEVFVPETKGFAQSIMMLWQYVVNFILLLAFVPAVELIGMDIVFYIFAACALATTVCTYFLLPETKGKNPYEIENLFLKRIGGSNTND